MQFLNFADSACASALSLCLCLGLSLCLLLVVVAVPGQEPGAPAAPAVPDATVFTAANAPLKLSSWNQLKSDGQTLELRTARCQSA